MEINVSNMPVGKLYQISDKRYVIKLLLKETRRGNYPSNEPSEFIEVYEKDDNEYMHRVASGGLVNNPSVFDFNKHFAIFDYDQDMIIHFDVEKFELVPQELSKVMEAIQREYNRTHGK